MRRDAQQRTYAQHGKPQNSRCALLTVTDAPWEGSDWAACLVEPIYLKLALLHIALSDRSPHSRQSAVTATHLADSGDSSGVISILS